jgi:hypothetical protein
MPIKNIPKKIYLQVGDIQDETVNFNELAGNGEETGITWCDEKIHDNDIEYCLNDKKACVAKGIITLCGSTRFYETFLAVNNSLTAKGYIVLSIGAVIDKAVMFDKSDIKLEKMLDKLHREKIAMSDSIFVIDVDGYIGKSTKSEIEFAEKHRKRIYRLSNGDLNKL